MTPAVIGMLIGLTAAVVVLLCLVLWQRRKMRYITQQLRCIPSEASNRLIHTLGSDRAGNELINTINELLAELRRSKILYNRKSHDLYWMMTNISHDLRTPLTSAMGYIRIIQSADMTEEERMRELQIVEKRLCRLEELIDTFFEFSRVVSGDVKPETEDLNLVAVLEEAMAHHYDDFTDQGREIVFCSNENKCLLTSNRHMLLRVLDNLIGNAYKHGTGPLRITLDSATHATIRFENAMSDSALEIERVFDEFYTTDISRTKGHTGLGLAIAKQFVEILGGRIHATYQDGIFCVTVEI